MQNKIERPEDSRKCLILLNEILRSEKTYLSKIADNLDLQRSNIQGYVKSMFEKGWIKREKKKKKVLYSLNPSAIWETKDHLDYLKGYRYFPEFSDQIIDLKKKAKALDEGKYKEEELQTNSEFDQNKYIQKHNEINVEVTELMNKIREKPLDPDFKDFLNQALVKKIEDSVFIGFISDDNEDEEKNSNVERIGPKDEIRETYKTVNTLLSEIVETIMDFEKAMRYLDVECEGQLIFSHSSKEFYNFKPSIITDYLKLLKD